MSPTVYIARHEDPEEVAVRVCVDRATAVRWLAERIKAEEWEWLYDDLDEDDRAGLNRDRDNNDHEALLRGWYGHGEADDDWGADNDATASVTPETILGWPVDQVTRVDPDDHQTCLRMARVMSIGFTGRRFEQETADHQQAILTCARQALRAALGEGGAR